MFLRPFVNHAVAIFIFLSGYLTKAENGNWGRFCVNRIIRVFIPYVIWTFVYTIPHLSTHDYVYNLLTTRAAAPLYYIAVYIQFVLLTPIISLLAKSRVRWLGWLISPVSIIVFKYLPWLGIWQYNDYVAIVWGISCLGWFSFYYLGFLLGNGMCRPKKKSTAYSVGFAIAFVLQILEGAALYKMGEVNCGTQMKLSCLVTNIFLLILVYRLIQNEQLLCVNKPMTLIGDYSFGIYLSHVLFIDLINRFPLIIPFPINSIMVFGMSLTFVWGLSKLVGYRVSRYLGLN